VGGHRGGPLHPPVNGQFDLLFSGGVYTSANYAEGYAVCTTPVGPCTQTDPNPILSSYGSVAGPAGVLVPGRLG